MRLIDADALKKSVPNTHVDIFENCRNCELLDDEQVEELIDNAPTIDAEPVRHANWIDAGNKIVCSRCNGSISFSLVDGKWTYGIYCQTCGAKMDKEDTAQWTE